MYKVCITGDHGFSIELNSMTLKTLKHNPGALRVGMVLLSGRIINSMFHSLSNTINTALNILVVVLEYGKNKCPGDASITCTQGRRSIMAAIHSKSLKWYIYKAIHTDLLDQAFVSPQIQQLNAVDSSMQLFSKYQITAFTGSMG